MPLQFVSVYMTATNKAEAGKIATALVEQRLVACVNVLDGVTSYFRWEGQVQAEAEVALIAKTRASLVADIEKQVKELHSYDCPCIVAWPLVDGIDDYLAWIGAETRDD